MIRLRNTRSFRNLHRKKSGTVRSGDRAGRAMSPKLRTQVTLCCTFQRYIATDHMKWRPLHYRSPSRQPRQAIAPGQYSNLKCVSRLRTTLYINSSVLVGGPGGGTKYFFIGTQPAIRQPRSVLWDSCDTLSLGELFPDTSKVRGAFFLKVQENQRYLLGLLILKVTGTTSPSECPDQLTHRHRVP